MPPPDDPYRALLRAARAVLRHLATGHRAKRVVVIDDEDSVAIDLKVPAANDAEAIPEKREPEERDVVPGWSFSERRAFYDGVPVTVATSRLRLLKVLVEADGPLLAKELGPLVFDVDTDEPNTRYHVAELRKELRSAFASFEGELIENTGSGYRLSLRK